MKNPDKAGNQVSNENQAKKRHLETYHHEEYVKIFKSGAKGRRTATGLAHGLATPEGIAGTEEVKAKEEECTSLQATTPPVDKSTHLPDEPLEFDPHGTPSHMWTSEKLLSYLLKCPRSNTEGFTKMTAITDDYVGMYKTMICCRFLHVDGSEKDLWMPQPIVYLTLHYHQLWKEWQRAQEAIDTSWDDWDKLQEANQQKAAKEQAQIDRERKQEVEDRAKKFNELQKQKNKKR